MALLELANKYRNEFLATVAATISVWMVVISKAWSSPALPKLLAEDSPIPITPDEGSWTLSILVIGGVIGPIISGGLVVDRIGRKWTLLGAVIPHSIGWTMIGLGDTLASLYVGRFLLGMAYGTVYTVCPMYLGEIASDSIRGMAGTMITVLAKLGFMFVYCVGPYVGYRTLAWISMIGPVLFVLCFLWMPETPYYLLGKNKLQQAERSLAWFRRSSAVAEELTAMKESVERSNEEKGSIKDLLLPSNRRSMQIVFILVFSIQLCGLTPILGYAQTIFELIPTNLKPEEMSIVLGAVQLVAVLIPVFLVDRMGRRPLLLLSSAGATLGLLGCCVCLVFITENTATITFGWLAFISLLVFIVFFGFGLATVPFAILSEIFPKDIKAYANVVFTASNALVLVAQSTIWSIYQKICGYIYNILNSYKMHKTAICVPIWRPYTSINRCQIT